MRDPNVHWELAERSIEAQVARMLSYRVVSLQSRGQVPNYEASIAKLYTSELQQRIAATGVKTIGLYGLLDRRSEWAPLRGRLMRAYLWAVGATIGGGTSEIQRNIIATRGLGLPRD
jgi:alkylation response protein AidB-like acyl-CoA dehydrogenase